MKARIREIPQRELRNDTARVLREVAAGAQMRVTVRGRPVADLVPITESRRFVPHRDVESILRESPLDAGFTVDVGDVLTDTVDDV